MTYLFDTDWLIDFLDGDATAHALISPLFISGLAISVITYVEIYHGIENNASPREDERVPRISASNEGPASQSDGRASRGPCAG